jgi:adenylylsulfate kinase-like enzyme
MSFYRSGAEHLRDLCAGMEERLMAELYLGRALGYLGERPSGMPGGSMTLGQAEALTYDDRAFEDAAARTEVRQRLERAEASEAQIAARLARSAEVGIAIPWARVAGQLDGHAFDLAVLALACAVELDPALARLCAFINDDLARPYADGGLALTLFGDRRRGAVAARTRLMPGAALFALGLLTVPVGREGADGQSVTRSPLRVARRVLDWLAGHEGLPADMHPWSTLSQDAAPPLEGLSLSDAELDARREALAAARDGEVWWLMGPRGTGRRTFAHGLAGALGRRLLVVDGAKVSGALHEGRLAQAQREAWLQDALLTFADVQALREDERTMVFRAAEAQPATVVLTTELGATTPRMDKRVRALEFGVPAYAERLTLWAAALADAGVAIEESALETAAARYRVTPGQVRECVRVQMDRAGAPDGARVSAWIDAAVGQVLTGDFGGLAVRILHRATRDDLVLPAEALTQLRQIASRHTHRAQVMETWAFGRRARDRHGITALFHGPSGTGKTMAASVLANELNMELFRVDLSQVMSKWIGDTEKQLARIFDEAEASHALLLFDEADSVFAKRTEVKETRDRYANLSTNYLLQRMEGFAGVCVLTTNLASSIDEAFSRRLHFRVHFPEPGPAERETLWRTMIPALAPLGDDVDFGWLGEGWEMSGGHIQSAVLRAAFLAAELDSPLTMAILERAANDEYQAMGRVVRTRV